MTGPYKLLFEARELLGKAHDRIAESRNLRGAHNERLEGICPELEALIERLNEACGVAPGIGD